MPSPHGCGAMSRTQCTLTTACCCPLCPWNAAPDFQRCPVVMGAVQRPRLNAPHLFAAAAACVLARQRPLAEITEPPAIYLKMHLFYTHTHTHMQHKQVMRPRTYISLSSGEEVVGPWAWMHGPRSLLPLLPHACLNTGPQSVSSSTRL